MRKRRKRHKPMTDLEIVAFGLAFLLVWAVTVWIWMGG